jgi:adenylate cyclase
MALQKILVIDDEKIIADLICLILGDVSFEVFCAYTGEDAIEMAMESKFDLVVVDAMLPGMSGIETFDVIRKTQSDIIGLLITGYADVDLLVDAMSHGFSGGLKKPFDPSDIVSAVKDAFAITALREENTRLKTLLPMYKLGEKFISATSLDEVYELLLDSIEVQIEVPSISLMVLDEEEACMVIVASRGMDNEIAGKVAIKPGDRIAGWVYTHKEAVILNKKNQLDSPVSKYLNRSEISASISFPLIGREKVLGVINISQTSKSFEYSPSDLEMLSVICGQAIMAIENVTYMEERDENVRTRALFEQYVAPEIAEILLSSGENPMETGGVHELSLLFADIRNFTLAVQHLSHQDLHLFLTEFFDLFSEIVFSRKGTLDKFMGDAALVICGAPIELEKASDAAIYTAVELSKGFEELCCKWLEKHPVFKHLGLGIGISRGDVFFGNVGSSRRLDYTVIGTDVNIAQRLASSAEAGKILITESVYNNVKDLFPTVEEASRILRGLEYEIKLYSIQADTVTIA